MSSWYLWFPFSRRSRFRVWTGSLHTKVKFLIWAFPVVAAMGGLAGGILYTGKKTGNLSTVIAEGSAGGSGVLLVGHIFDVDVDLRQVQISWLVDGCGEYQMAYTMSYNIQTCGRLNASANFYVDGFKNPSGSHDAWATPYQIDGNLVYVDSYVYIQAINEFQTSHSLETVDWHGLDQLYAYPFDTYFFDTSLIALDADTNASFPLLSATPVDSTNGFTPYILETVEIHRPNPTGSGSVDARYVRIALRRTILTQFFIMSLFIANWALTGMIVFITISANDGVDMKNSILVLPLTVVVTIPALRALWIGAPAFGLMLDIIGIFMQMIIIALCSIWLVVRIGLSGKIARELRRRRMHRRASYNVSVDELIAMYNLPETSHRREDSGRTLVEDASNEYYHDD